MDEDQILSRYGLRSGYDAHASIDVQLLCGAGLPETLSFLADSSDADLQDALGYLRSCQQAGDFDEFSVAEQSAEYDAYYGLDA